MINNIITELKNNKKCYVGDLKNKEIKKIIRELNFKLHIYVILKNGYLVLDGYFYKNEFIPKYYNNELVENRHIYQYYKYEELTIDKKETKDKTNKESINNNFDDDIFSFME